MFDAKTATQAMIDELDAVGFDAAPDTETHIVERHMRAAHRAGLEEASKICSDMLDANDFGLDRERTVAEVRHRINLRRVCLGQESTNGET
jgi:hypothetical protein